MSVVLSTSFALRGDVYAVAVALRFHQQHKMCSHTWCTQATFPHLSQTQSTYCLWHPIPSHMSPSRSTILVHPFEDSDASQVLFVENFFSFDPSFRQRHSSLAAVSPPLGSSTEAHRELERDAPFSSTLASIDVTQSIYIIPCVTSVFF